MNYGSLEPRATVAVYAEVGLRMIDGENFQSLRDTYHDELYALTRDG